MQPQMLESGERSLNGAFCPQPQFMSGPTTLVVPAGAAASNVRFLATGAVYFAQLGLSSSESSASFVSTIVLSPVSFAANGEPTSGSAKSWGENERIGVHFVEPAISM